MHKEIDIIIPSFRLEERYILPLLQLPKPAGWRFQYYIIVDNPLVKVPGSIARWDSPQEPLQLIINLENLGAAGSRNKGLAAGRAEWVLFLDDDIQADQDLLIQYARQIERSPDEIGFIGLTDFPAPTGAFTHALENAYLTGMFKIARIREYFSWGVTANMMYRRSAMQGLHFSEVFPKNGGGEDIDLPYRISRLQQREFRCLPQARVIHPWWNNGKPQFDRFARYGTGNAYLIRMHPKQSWWDFPNPVESMLLLLLLSPLLFLYAGAVSWLVILLGIVAFEYLITALKAKRKGKSSLKIVHYMVLLNASQDWGMLLAIFKTASPGLFMKRIYLGYPKSGNFHLNRYKLIKLILFLLLFLALYYFKQ